MIRIFAQPLGATLLFAAVTISGWAENAKPCRYEPLPSIWVRKTPYPFQAGSERTFDELYHGPWKARVDIIVYARPRSSEIVGRVTEGSVVDALIGESIVVHPLRFTASKDFQVWRGFKHDKVSTAVIRKNDVFWVLNLGGEGGFAVWWHCSVVGWDSTETGDVEEHGLELLGTNEERWVKIRDRKTGLTGWFNDETPQDGPNLVPGRPTQKGTG